MAEVLEELEQKEQFIEKLIDLQNYLFNLIRVTSPVSLFLVIKQKTI